MALPGNEFTGVTQKILSIFQGNHSRCTDGITFAQLENLREQLQGIFLGCERKLFCSSSQNSLSQWDLAAEVHVWR